LFFIKNTPFFSEIKEQKNTLLWAGCQNKQKDINIQIYRALNNAPYAGITRIRLKGSEIFRLSRRATAPLY
jgi:hypothetical protein